MVAEDCSNFRTRENGRNDNIRLSLTSLLGVQTTLLDKVIESGGLDMHIEKMPVDSIPCSALHARFEEK